MVAPSMVRAVRFAGGWLFDRVMAGWDVSVHVADHTDTRPLRILGARAVDLERTLTSRAPLAQPLALAVDAELYESDARVRKMVLDAVERKLTEVRLWGSDVDGPADAMCHQLSVAARAFKAQALAAAAAPVESIDLTETFCRGDLSARHLLAPAVPSQN